MLKIKNFSAISDNQEAINFINFDVNEGEIHAIVGDEQSGVSVLCRSITRHPSVQTISGEIFWKKKKIHKSDPSTIFNLGIFSTTEYPCELPGMTNWELTQRLFPEFPVDELQSAYTKYCEDFQLGFDHSDKQQTPASVSIGQAKRNDLIHMMLADPQCVILDNLDVGLSEKEITFVSNYLKSYFKEKNQSILIFSNNKMLLSALSPTIVHLMKDGSISESGDLTLLEKVGDDNT